MHEKYNSNKKANFRNLRKLNDSYLVKFCLKFHSFNSFKNTFVKQTKNTYINIFIV